MKPKHDYLAKIDYELWIDINRVKELDGGVTSINSLVNEGLKLVRNRKMQELSVQRKQRESLSMITEER
tara:strand:+ start:391 stop:597 length:207 start_codon:yes stop_codon:yes gene_type:complete